MSLYPKSDLSYSYDTSARSSLLQTESNFSEIGESKELPYLSTTSNANNGKGNVIGSSIVLSLIIVSIRDKFIINR